MPTSITAYTPLETLFLFQLIPKHGLFEPASFANISNDITNHRFIVEDKSYDAARLTPGALQELFLQLLRDEVKRDDGQSNGDKAPGSTSPNTKKRKLPSPPLPSLNEARAHLDKLPALSDRAYAKYVEARTKEINEEDQRYWQLNKEIDDLAAAEEAEKLRNAAATPATPAKAGETRESPVEERRPAVNGTQGVPGAQDVGGQVVNGSRASPASVPAPPAQTPARVSPVLPRQPPPVGAAGTPLAPTGFAPPNITGPAASAPTGLGIAQNGTPKSVASTGPILQAPQGTVPYPPRSGSSTPHPPGTETSRAGSAARASGTPQPSGPPLSSGQLKWEPPYTPNQSQRAGVGPAHPPSKSPIPGRASPAAPQYQQGPQHAQSSFAAPNIPPQQQQLPRQSHQAVLAAPQVPPNLAATNLSSGAPSPGAPDLTRNFQHPAPNAAQAHLGAGRGVPTQAPGVPSPQARIPPGALAPGAFPSSVPGAAGVATPAAASRATALPAPNTGARTPAALQTQPRPQGLPQGQHMPPGAPPATPSATPAASHGASFPIGTPQANIAPSSGKQIQQSVADSLAKRIVTPAGFPKPHQPQFAPITPLHKTITPLVIPRGSGTKWKNNNPTPSTPGPDRGEVASPAFEPLSPPLVAAQLPNVASQSSSKKAPPKGAQVPEAMSSRKRGKQPAGTGAAQTASDTPRIKSEEDVGHKPPEETGDTTAEESGPSRRRVTPASSRPVKRKRAESVTGDSQTPLPVPISTPPSHVLWTRGFPRISASVLDHTSSHRNANMFAHKIRDRDAPGYSNIVLHPIDLKSIRAAIQQGNRAATAAAAALPDADPNASSVWLPISEELVPPRGIINSSQLECELVHMFANAIMYNPDPRRGPGPAFMIKETAADAEDGDDANVLGYAVDQHAVVNDTRAMYVEVEKLLTEMRSAERGAPPLPPGATGTGANANLRPSLMGFGDADPAATEEEDREETAGTEAEGSGTIKRRRIARG